jgi:hypothetical protein
MPEYLSNSQYGYYSIKHVRFDSAQRTSRSLSEVEVHGLWLFNSILRIAENIFSVIDQDSGWLIYSFLHDPTKIES